MEEVVFNCLNLDGMREVKLISDVAVSHERMLAFVPADVVQFAQVNCYETASLRLFYGEVKFPVRTAVDFHCEGFPKWRRLFVWKLMPGERVSEVIEQAACRYFVMFHRKPNYAFVRKMPAGIENGIDVDGLILLEADWALSGCVMVGG